MGGTEEVRINRNVYFSHEQNAKTMTSPTKIPAWFWVIGIIMLLWNLMGIASFYMHVFISEEALQALPEAERALFGQYPTWTAVVFALATFGGLFGCIALLLKKKVAQILFIVSLVAIIVQMSHSLFMTDSVEVYGTGAYYMPIMVVLIGAFLVWFSGHGTKKGWLS